MENSRHATENAEQVALDLQTRLQASEEKSEGLSTALLITKTALGDHIAMVKEITALADTSKSKSQHHSSAFHTELQSYLRGAKTLDVLNVS